MKIKIKGGPRYARFLWIKRRSGSFALLKMTPLKNKIKNKIKSKIKSKIKCKIKSNSRFLRYAAE